MMLSKFNSVYNFLAGSIAERSNSLDRGRVDSSSRTFFLRKNLDGGLS